MFSFFLRRQENFDLSRVSESFRATVNYSKDNKLTGNEISISKWDEKL